MVYFHSRYNTMQRELHPPIWKQLLRLTQWQEDVGWCREHLQSSGRVLGGDTDVGTEQFSDVHHFRKQPYAWCLAWCAWHDIRREMVLGNLWQPGWRVHLLESWSAQQLEWRIRLHGVRLQLETLERCSLWRCEAICVSKESWLYSCWIKTCFQVFRKLNSFEFSGLISRYIHCKLIILLTKQQK